MLACESTAQEQLTCSF